MVDEELRYICICIYACDAFEQCLAMVIHADYLNTTYAGLSSRTCGAGELNGNKRNELKERAFVYSVHHVI